jgi:hypothetical protein
MPEKISGILSPTERADSFRSLAQALESSAAEAATAELCECYLAGARQWRDMAGQLEADAQKVVVRLDPPEATSPVRPPEWGYVIGFRTVRLRWLSAP